MCGIAGFFHRGGRAVDPETLLRMTRVLTHRGPDEEGYFLNRHGTTTIDGAPVRGLDKEGAGDVGLGHRRLSIIDLKSGQQPLSNEDDSVWITFNGEIYNFPELKAELEAKGHRFRTNSDTETIVHAWEEWGEETASRLRGMFAFAIWDENQQRLYLARDRLGKKPLYYAEHDNRFFFGSELKTVLEVPGFPRDIDIEALSDYLSTLYVPAPKSIFKAARKLPQAHYAVVTRDKTIIRPYWDLKFNPVQEGDAESFGPAIVESLREAVKMRMMSEVPLGAFLSGGVDSSAVVALMAGASDTPVKTSSISFSVAEYDESSYARQIAELFSTEHHEYHVTPEAIPIIEKLAWHYDEPFADSSAVPTYYVSKTARETVTVALSGDGGDENFAGYRRYWFDHRENMARRLVPAALRSSVFGTLSRISPRGKKFFGKLSLDPVDAYADHMCSFNDTDKLALLQPDVVEALGGYKTVDMFRDIYNRADAPDHLSRILYLDIKTYLTEDILTKVDRASMAVSLEVRCPVLDHVFMENAAQIPSGLKFKGGEKKYVFKKALEKLLPHDILYRPKMGFGVPLPEWLRGDLKSYARDLVLDGEATKLFLQRPFVERVWNEHQSKVDDRSGEIWRLMMLNLWYRRFAMTGVSAGSTA
ncbi:MAG: asparagine synthase (glutamine-hydrolyzing) [Planctomycetota bacterium]